MIEEAYFSVDLESEPGEYARLFRARLLCGTERADLHLLLPPRDRFEGKVPLILMVPILAGGSKLLSHVAGELADRGFAVAWCRRAGSPLTAEQRGPDLERLFQRTVVQLRMALAWARRHPLLEPGHQGLLGISLGGMVGSVVLALEPEIQAGALVLAGADLPAILAASSEGRVVRWRDAKRSRDGLAGSQLVDHLRRTLKTDPARYGAHVETERVLLVDARYDTVVPREQQDLLWESFGRPHRVTLPLGHYTAAFALGRILDAAEELYRSRGLIPEG